MLLFLISSLIIASAVRAEDYVHSPIHYHSQTDKGTYNYGYDTGLFGSHQFHQEYKDAGGQVRGRYGYTDPHGKLRLVHYTSGPQGYEVISDTELDKSNKPSAHTRNPVLTNVIERYNVVHKRTTNPIHVKPRSLRSGSSPVPTRLLYERSIRTESNRGNGRVVSYQAGRDYGRVNGYPKPEFSRNYVTHYSRTEPSYVRTEPAYVRTEPAFVPTTPALTRTEPAYVPTAPALARTEPAYVPTAPALARTEPAYVRTDPALFRTEPAYALTEPGYVPTESAYVRTEPEYIRSEPAYVRTQPGIVPTVSIPGIQSPAKRLRAASLTGRSIGGVRV